MKREAEFRTLPNHGPGGPKTITVDFTVGFNNIEFVSTPGFELAFLPGINMQNLLEESEMKILKTTGKIGLGPIVKRAKGKYENIHEIRVMKRFEKLPAGLEPAFKLLAGL